jgi:bis(5'-nucleosyl)-tetraphosphatase (symmetrical)
VRTIVVGDIHGCLEEFDELVKLVSYKQGGDRLILVGDLIDRGPYSAGVVRRAREIGAECIRANHEETAIRYRSHEAKKLIDPGYRNPMRPRSPERIAEWAQISDDNWAWLGSLPYWARFGTNWTAVHAGARSYLPMRDQDPRELIRMRFVHNVTGKMVALNDGNDPEDSHPWYDDWKGSGIDMHIVYGHHVYKSPNINGTLQTGYTVGIDTGCCFGGKLTAMIHKDDQDPQVFTFVDVTAKQVYSDLGKSWITDGR